MAEDRSDMGKRRGNIAGVVGSPLLGKLLSPVVAFLLFLAAFSASSASDLPTGGLVPDEGLQSMVEGYLADFDALYGVAVVNLEDGRSVFVNSERGFPTASLYKLLVMYRILQDVDRGYLSMDDVITIRWADMESVDEGDVDFWPGETLTVGDALYAMITWSSNVSAHALARVTGGWGYVAEAAEELGMYNTVLEDDFWTTPNDMAHFFRLLASESLVSPEASRQMIDLLLAQQVNDRIPALLPDHVQVAHKTGELEDVRNDGGIVFTPDGRYVVVMMSRGGDPDEETWAEAVVSWLIYSQYGASAD